MEKMERNRVKIKVYILMKWKKINTENKSKGEKGNKERTQKVHVKIEKMGSVLKQQKSTGFVCQLCP